MVDLYRVIVESISVLRRHGSAKVTGVHCGLVEQVRTVLARILLVEHQTLPGHLASGVVLRINWSNATSVGRVKKMSSQKVRLVVRVVWGSIHLLVLSQLVRSHLHILAVHLMTWIHSVRVLCRQLHQLL